ncbi:adenylate/guanylate cyclase domain-containing protein [Robiginitalea sp. SC105]|uniref:adenylate/guanylate cyclase domain-containing protein n=1 Tax=Robiginitalea sp. SC105 TaxID=2762332 RepID=UPI001639B795|nr:adenylate/guanylate cyclase domain-containing protein [Robiginitalea sp. SC105]MBC2838139.1 tetratricopeptide repeat protein [Robiginitalea sp. SC105]
MILLRRLVFCILLFPGTMGFCQDQRKADSLLLLLREYPEAEQDTILYWLSNISFNHTNPDSSLYYARLIVDRTDDPVYLYQAAYNEGVVHRLQGNLDKSLEAFFNSLEYASRSGEIRKEGTAFLAIGDVYSVSGAHQNSTTYYSRAVNILREVGDTENLAIALFNLGDEYLKQDSLEEAGNSFEQAGALFENLGYTSGLAYVIGNMGIIRAGQGKDSLAAENLNRAIGILEEQEDYYAISDYLPYLADIYLEQGDPERALSYARRSLELAKELGLKEQISLANQKLSELYEQLGNTDASLRHYKAYVAYRDSVNNLESMQQMADLRTNFEVSQKQAEVDLLNQEKRTQRIVVIATGVALFLILVLAVVLFRRNRFIRETNRIIEKEKQRSDSLLLNILPEETAEELKEKGKVQAKKFESVSILFTDFKGFTSFAEKMSPEALVEKVDYYFSHFDGIIEKHGLEKIKTIGDAYMCAGGLPFALEDHARKTVEAAREIAEFVREAADSLPEGQPRFDIRIGINTGPVVAGVVGTKKFAYDIWGDAVNIASRMESNSEPGRINISEDTYKLVREDFECEYRGIIEVKNRGKLKMYFVN